MDKGKVKKQYGLEPNVAESNLVESLIKVVKKFEYLDIEQDENINLLCKNTKIIELESKHYIVLNDRTCEIKRLGESAGNPNILWGYNRKATADTERKAILGMANINFKRPARIIIDNRGRLWADNTHTLLSWLYRLGEDATLDMVPFYIVDVRYSLPRIIDINNTISDSMTDIKKAIACGIRINYYNDMGWRPIEVRWTLEDLALNMGLPKLDASKHNK